MATRKIVPRSDDEGGIGTALKQWASGWIKLLTVTTINALTLVAASVGFTIAGGTTSKTLTVSSDADTKDIIRGDGTAGRVLRQIKLRIADGTTSATLKCTTENLWNGDANGPTDNVPKGGEVGVFNLSADGTVLIVLNAGISGTPVAVLAVAIYENASGTALFVSLYLANGHMYFRARNTSGVSLDLTTLVNTGQIQTNVTYITDA